MREIEANPKKILLLDLGGVLILSRRSEVYRSWATKLGKDVDEVRLVVRDYHQILMHGESISISEYLADNKITWIDVPSFQQLEKELWDSEYVNHELLDFLLQHADKYEYALLTNNFKGIEEVLEEKFAIPKFYKELINSSKAGITKPNSKIYEYALGVLNVPAEQCIFVDDQAENVQAAIDLHMAGILYRDFASFKDELENLP